MSKKILIFNPETGKTEKEIMFTEGNAHRMNFLPSLGYVAVMHGYWYDKGFSVSLINLETRKFDKMVYVLALAPVLKEIDGKIYGSGNNMPNTLTNKGFGIYSLDESNLNLETIFPLTPANDSVGSCLIDVNKFLVLEDGTFVVCDHTIGIKIQYPDGTTSELLKDDTPFDPDIGNYKTVKNIYYSQTYDRIYVEMYGDILYKFAEKDDDEKWQWNTTTMLEDSTKDEYKKHATIINGDILAETLRDKNDTVFITKFYDIKDFTLLKEVQWNLETDKKTETVY